MHRSIWLRMRTLIFRMMTKGKMQSFLKKHFKQKESESREAGVAQFVGENDEVMKNSEKIV